MRQVTRKGLITVAAAGGVLAMTGSAALADSDAKGGAENSPGVLSGNSVEVPVDAPVNACGNTVSVVGALNPATGNRCAGDGGSHGGGHGSQARAEGGTANSPGVGSGNNVKAPVDVPVDLCGNSANVVGVGNPAMGNGCGDGSSGYPATSQQSAPGGHGQLARSDPRSGRTGTGPQDGKGDPRSGEHTGEHGGAPGSTPETGSSAKQADVRAASSPEGGGSGDASVFGAGGELAESGAGQGLALAAPLGAGFLVGGYVLFRRARGGRRTARH
ncbi:chaplin [Streptomyces sp. NPDC054796]